MAGLLPGLASRTITPDLVRPCVGDGLLLLNARVVCLCRGFVEPLTGDANAMSALTVITVDHLTVKIKLLVKEFVGDNYNRGRAFT